MYLNENVRGVLAALNLPQNYHAKIIKLAIIKHPKKLPKKRFKMNA